MEQLVLSEIKIEKISFINDVQVSKEEGTIEVRLGAKISSSVSYNTDNTKCKCVTTVELIPNPKVNFGATIVVVGVFDFNKDQNHKDIHISACKKLFPHVQATTSAFMNMVGFPNFILDEPQLDIDNVTEDNS